MSKGVLWYDIKNNKNFRCPHCGTDLILEERRLNSLYSNGKIFNILGSDIRLFCPKCNIDMTHQLKLDGNETFKLINYEEREKEEKIKYNKQSNGFFKED